MQKFGEKNPAYKHGLNKTRFQLIHTGMKRRCNDINHKDYKKYGAKNIKCFWNTLLHFKEEMYDEYLEHVKKFGEKDTQIDRIDGTKGYYKENCRWVTKKEQARNLKSNKKITYMGKTHCISEWAEIININRKCLEHRIRNGWPISDALTKKISHANRIILSPKRTTKTFPR